MATSVFLARLVGPVVLLMGLVVLLQPIRVRTMAREMLEGEAFMFLAGLMALPIGLALVNTHNVWVWDWRVLITILGWLTLVSGVARIAFGRQLKSIGAVMVDTRMGLAIPGASLLLIGLWLSFVGYIG